METLITSIAIVAAAATAVLWRRSVVRARSLESAVRSAAKRPSSSAAEREALRLGRILGALPDGVLVIERREVTFANLAASRLVGGDPARLVPTILGSARPSFVVTVHHPSYREVRCTRTELDRGAILVLVRDVTEQRRLDRMRQDFVANASHELKTPASAIRATSETLEHALEDGDREAARRFAATLAREAGRLSELVQDLLDLTRLDQAAGEIGERCDAAEVLRALVAEVAERAGDVAVRLDPRAEGPLQVPVRAGDLALAVRNLVDNAIRHTPSGGTVTVALERRGDDAVIAVSDTGEGIPARDLPRIFERFYRVDPARSRETGGTGLGLAIVKHVVETGGGRVHAASTYGQGSTFTITLPLAG